MGKNPPRALCQLTAQPSPQLLARTNWRTPMAPCGRNVGIREVAENIWLVSFMRYDLGFFDHETCRIESAENPFAAKVSPMSPV